MTKGQVSSYILSSLHVLNKYFDDDLFGLRVTTALSVLGVFLLPEKQMQHSARLGTTTF